MLLHIPSCHLLATYLKLLRLFCLSVYLSVCLRFCICISLPSVGYLPLAPPPVRLSVCLCFCIYRPAICWLPTSSSSACSVCLSAHTSDLARHGAMVYGVRRPTPQLLPRSQSVHMHAECSLCSLLLVHFLNRCTRPQRADFFFVSDRNT